MPSVVATIHIVCPAAVVYSFVTTPQTWPLWQPSALSVSGAVGHSLHVGESVAGDFLVAGRAGQVVWTVVQRVAPRLWVIEGRIVDNNMRGEVRYQTLPTAQGTRFERTFTYETFVPITRIQDALALQRTIRMEAERALSNLKRLLEEAV
jgi:hypothetical protein